MRTCSPSLSAVYHWDQFDGKVRDSLNRILGCHLTDTAWLQTQLPVSKGGSGLRCTAKHASVAYIASLASCRDLVEDVTTDLQLNLDLSEAISHLNNVLCKDQDGDQEGLTEAIVITLKQRELSIMVDNVIKGSLLDSVETTREKARLHSVALPHAGDWLFVVPSPSPGLNLRPAEFRAAMLYRLGMPIFDSEGPCIACGNTNSDCYGDHTVGCTSR